MGVPQGSVLGPLLFTIFISPIVNIVAQHSIQQHQYADDTTLYVSMSKNSKAQTVEDLQRCLRSVHTWLAQNGLALNPDKTDVLRICPIWQQGTEASIDVLDVAEVNIKPVEKVKLLGVSLDHRLDYGPHVKNVCANSFYHIRALKHIRRSINKECANEIACAIVNTRLDYCNSLLWGTSQSNIIALQRCRTLLPGSLSVQGCVIRSPLISSHFTGCLSNIESSSKSLHWSTRQSGGTNHPISRNFYPAGVAHAIFVQPAWICSTYHEHEQRPVTAHSVVPRQVG